MFQFIYSLILAVALVACTEESPLPDRDGDGAPDQVDQFPDDINKAFIVLTNVTGLRGQVKLTLNDNEILADSDGPYQFDIPYAEAFNLKAEHLVEDQLCEISQPSHDGRSVIETIEISCSDRVRIEDLLSSIYDPGLHTCIRSSIINKINWISFTNGKGKGHFYAVTYEGADDYEPIAGLDLGWVDQVTELDCNYEVENAEGIEKLSHLTSLSIELKQLWNSEVTEPSFIDLSHNHQLEEVEVHTDKLNVTGLKKLMKLTIAHYSGSDIDLSGLDNLKELSVFAINLGKLELNQLKGLEILGVSSYQIESMDLTALQDLKIFLSISPSLTDINISNNDKLESLGLFQTRIERLDVSENSKLSWLMLSDNNLKEIDVSNNENLSHLELRNNQLRNVPRGIRVIKKKEATIDLTGNPFSENSKADLAILKEHYTNLIYDEDN
jgi:hypothetical protein